MFEQNGSARWATIGLLTLLAGCNALTGVNDLLLQGENRGEGGASSASGSNASASTAEAASSGSGNVSSGTVGATTGTGASASSGGATVTTGGATECAYPTGPAGNTAGDILDKSYAWQAFLPGASSMTAMSPEDLFDCDGSRGINAVLLIGAQTNCGACQAEAQALPGHAAEWESQGIRVVVLMFDSNAETFRDYFGLESVAVGNDPEYSLLQVGSNGTPINLFVDPRTMEIVERFDGWSQSPGFYAPLEQLAAENAN